MILKMSNNSALFEIVPTKATAFQKEAKSDFKAVVFESRKPKLPQENKLQQSDRFEDKTDTQHGKHKKKHHSDEGLEFDMKRARHEVINFGISGFATRNKKKGEIALAVKLGAKAPRKVYKNYKDLLSEKEVSKKRREETVRLRQLGKNQSGAAIVRYKKPKSKKGKDSGEISKHYGVINPKIGKKT